MRDDDLEQLLQRYEPAAPPSSLHARVLGTRPAAQRAWPWVVSAAALLAMTVWLHASRDRELQEPLIGNAPSPRAEEALLIEMLGGSDDARAIARTIVALDDAAQRNAAPVGTTGTTGAER